MKEILNRVSTRTYSDKKIEKEKIEKLLLAGMSAPSARNQRPWEFLVVDDKSLLNQISEKCKNHYMAKDAPLAIIVLGNNDKVTSEGYVMQDLAASTENILIEATYLNLASVWLGVAPNTERMENIKNIFNLKDNYFAFSIIVLGYSDNIIPKERKYDESLVHYNKLNDRE